MSNWRKHHVFDPYRADCEARAAKRVEEQKLETDFYKNRALRQDPDEQLRRIIHTNQLVRSKKRPPTLPKVWV